MRQYFYGSNESINMKHSSIYTISVSCYATVGIWNLKEGQTSSYQMVHLFVGWSNVAKYPFTNKIGTSL